VVPFIPLHHLQNSREWSAFNPHEIKEIPLHDQNAGVRCAETRSRTLRRTFFAAIINSNGYQLILHPSIGQLNEDNVARSYFQQDGAIAQRAHVSTTFERDVLDSYLWGAMKA
jgi:hypothetical protein